jgi:serine/threonine-protein kinase
MIGERLGKWVVYKELGRGGMGQVYLAQEELTGRQAALKVLAAELAQDTGFLHRFQREIQTLSTVDHPNIVHFYESGFENGLYFYAMEYVEGQGLDSVLEEKGRLPWRDVLDIALQVCPALKHAHDHGIIHRDIKPANLLRTSAGMIKLTDFGIAKVFAGTHLTATGGVVGTAEYLSPEQAAGKPVSKRSDLYSLGVVLYTLLTGRTPFEGTTFLEMLHKHRYAQFDPPRSLVVDIPYELDEVVCELLAKEPEKRPADALVLAKRLEVVRRKLERKGNLTSAGDAGSETVADNKPDEFDPDNLPGPATLMSRLMREELLRQARGGPFYRFINRPVILVVLFILCIGLLVWTFWPASAQGLYEQGARLMASPNPSDWELAWRDYLEPLGQRFPDHPYQKEVEEYRQRLDNARAKDKPSGVSEAERFFRQGAWLRQEGNTAEAKDVWQNVVAVFGEVPSEAEWVRRARDGLAELEKAAGNTERWAPVCAALKQAAELAGQGNRKAAEAIWTGVEALYRNDPAARDILAEVRAARVNAEHPKGNNKTPGAAP